MRSDLRSKTNQQCLTVRIPGRPRYASPESPAPFPHLSRLPSVEQAVQPTIGPATRYSRTSRARTRVLRRQGDHVYLLTKAEWRRWALGNAFRLKRKLQMLFQVAKPPKSLLFSVVCVRDDLEGKALIKVVIIHTRCHEAALPISVWTSLQHFATPYTAARKVCQSQDLMTDDRAARR